MNELQARQFFGQLAECDAISRTTIYRWRTDGKPYFGSPDQIALLRAHSGFNNRWMYRAEDCREFYYLTHGNTEAEGNHPGGDHHTPPGPLAHARMGE